MTDRELMQQALEALERYGGVDQRACDAEEALRERLAQPEQEPVAWYHPKSSRVRFENPNSLLWTPLYTAPRQWQGLTNEERGQVINANFGTGLWQMAKEIEAKLRERNT